MWTSWQHLSPSLATYIGDNVRPMLCEWCSNVPPNFEVRHCHNILARLCACCYNAVPQHWILTLAQRCTWFGAMLHLNFRHICYIHKHLYIRTSTSTEILHSSWVDRQMKNLQKISSINPDSSVWMESRPLRNIFLHFFNVRFPFSKMIIDARNLYYYFDQLRLIDSIIWNFIWKIEN